VSELDRVENGKVIEASLTRVHDQTTFLRELLIGALGWPIDAGNSALVDIAYEWTDAELRANDLAAHVVEGKAYQFVMADNPWGVFLLEFSSADPVVSGRGMTGVLRSVLNGLVAKKRGARDPRLAAFDREHLLFICTHDYRSYRFAYFRAPDDGLRTAPLTSFGWTVDEPGGTRTVCEFNLAGLVWPEVTPTTLAGWVQAWGRAFDVERVTRRFYEDYAGVFNGVETLIAGATLISGEDLRLFTQSLFNRLMFLRFLERKGWLSFPDQRGTAYLAAVAAAGGIDGQSLYKSRLRPLFFDGLALGVGDAHRAYGDVPFLNGGLFEEGRLDSLVDDVPDDVFRSVIGPGGLFYRYNFTVEESTPLDVDVAVDPEMLGRVFEELVTGRHGTGSYYTPRPLVSYMCRQVLKRFLSDTTDAPVGPLARLIDDGIVDGLTEAHAQAIEQALDGMKALDPACGSGAYLLGLLHELIDIRRSLRNVRLAPDDQYLYRLKLHIISESLYGVDIDPFATEIAKLRLWLSLAVDSDRPVPLPNLDFKIETGDSLGAFAAVPDGLFDASLRERAGRLVELKAQYLTAHGDDRLGLRAAVSAEEHEVANDLRHLVGPGVIDWHVQFAEVLTQRSGFDLVLANPPYVSALEFLRVHSREERERIRGRFSSAAGAWDLYVPFFERGVQLLRPGGYLAYISPNKYLSASYGEALREYLRAETAFLELVDLSRIPVFSSASVYPVLTFLRKGHGDEDITCRQPGRTNPLSTSTPSEFAIVHVPQSSLDLLPEKLWGFLLSDRLELLIRLLANTSPMHRYADVLATTTAAESDEYGQQLREDDGTDAFRVVNTGTIDPYMSLWGHRSLIKQRTKYRCPVLPKMVVSARRNVLYRTRKILVAKLAARCEAFLDSEGIYAGMDVNCVAQPKAELSLEFLCGYMNSSVFMFFYEQFFGALRMSGGYYQFQAPQLRVMPVPHVTPDECQLVEERVQRIVALSEPREDQDKLTADLRTLDVHFGRLFGINEEALKQLDTAPWA
jgi:hypothetical protein